MLIRNYFGRLAPVLLVVGAILLGYVAWSYGSMYWEQRQLAREWERQQQSRPVAGQSASTQAKPVNDSLTRLTVPKIDLDSVIVEGTSYRALRLGPGHMRKTPEPGENGNVVITGHRDTFFRHISDLVMGDEVVVQRGGKKYVYKVTGKKVVEPTDMSVVAPSKDSRLTLITCYPTYYIGPAPKRLVVSTKLVDEKAEVASAGR